MELHAQSDNNRRFQELLDLAEAGDPDGCRLLRKLCSEICLNAPIGYVTKAADLILRLQRQACRNEQDDQDY